MRLSQPVRSSILALAATLAVAPLVARAQTADAAAGGSATTAPEVENAPYTIAGEVKTDKALVHSGPSDRDYPTAQLAKGTRVTVVGTRNDWLKIVPPEGSFCLVPQAYINRRGSGNVGRVEMKAPVRIGSSMTQAKYKVPVFLEPGTDVQILSEAEEMYKIAPPAGVYLYIEKSAVDPVKRLDQTANGGQQPTPPAPDDKNTTPPAPPADNTADANKTDPANGGVATNDKGNSKGNAPLLGRPDGEQFTVKKTGEDPAAAATTQPSLAEVDQIKELQEKLVALEDRYGTESKKDVSERPLDAMLKDYQALLDSPALPPNAKRVVTYRISTLQMQKAAADQYAEAKRTQAAIAAKQQALQQQQQTLQAQVAQSAVKRYAAIGRLMASTLQAGNEPLYRLADPANGRTIIYVRLPKGQPIGNDLNQFVAVKGQVVKDDAMKITYVTPEAFEACDPAQVNRKVFADYAPPSMATANLTSADAAGAQ